MDKHQVPRHFMTPESIRETNRIGHERVAALRTKRNARRMDEFEALYRANHQRALESDAATEADPDIFVW